MNILCAICQDALESSNDINIIPCGHVFHFPCLNQWLEKSLTCPQCRMKVRREKMNKIYFNFANVEVIKEDSFTLQQRIDSLSFNLKLKETEANKNKEELVALKKQNIGLRDEVKRVESEVHEKTSAIYALKEQTAFFKNKSLEYDKLKERNKQLCRTLETYDNVQLLINGSGEEVERMLGTNRDVTTLTTYIGILKRELGTNIERRKELRGIIKNLQSDVQSLKIKRDSFAQDYVKRIEDLEEELTICRSERETLQAKVVELKQRLSNQNSPTEECSGESNVAENRMSRKRDIDFKENSDAIAKKAKRTQEIFKSTLSPNKDDSDLVFVEPNRKKHKENTQDSPYLPTKSKGILSMKSRSLTSRSSHWIQSNGNSSSMKKSELPAKHRTSREKEQTIAFDGFGGHSKIEVFPKTSPNKHKRPLSDTGKSKKLKLDLDRNNKIDDYIINLT